MNNEWRFAAMSYKVYAGFVVVGQDGKIFDWYPDEADAFMVADDLSQDDRCEQDERVYAVG
jgi:hypothetical protein